MKFKANDVFMYFPSLILNLFICHINVFSYNLQTFFLCMIVSVIKEIYHYKHTHTFWRATVYKKKSDMFSKRQLDQMCLEQKQFAEKFNKFSKEENLLKNSIEVSSYFKNLLLLQILDFLSPHDRIIGSSQFRGSTAAMRSIQKSLMRGKS